MGTSDDLIPEIEKPEEPEPSLWAKLESHVQGKTLAGLFELVPLIVTVVVLVVIIGYADSAVRGLPFVKDEPWDFWGVGMIVAIVVFYLVGVIIATRIGRFVMNLMDTVLNHIPVVKTILGVTKQAMATLTSKYQFTRVVFVEWPREGMVAMGFVTGRAYSSKTARVDRSRLYSNRSQSHFRQHGPRPRRRHHRDRSHGRGRDEADLLRRHRAAGSGVLGQSACRTRGLWPHRPFRDITRLAPRPHDPLPESRRLK